MRAPKIDLDPWPGLSVGCASALAALAITDISKASEFTNLQTIPPLTFGCTLLLIPKTFGSARVAS